MSIKEIGRFDAVSDSGKHYTIRQLQHYKAIRQFGPAQPPIATIQEYKTTTGLSVNYIDANTFKIVQTDEVVRKL